MKQQNKSCKTCEEAKKAMLLLNKIGFTNLSVICNSCEMIWRWGKK